MIHFTSETLQTLPPLRVAMDALMHRHGRLRVIIATIAALSRVAVLRRDIGAMPDHLRRDIGLPTRADPPHPRETMR